MGSFVELDCEREGRRFLYSTLQFRLAPGAGKTGDLLALEKFDCVWAQAQSDRQFLAHF
jgi:hypothetical protein